VTFDALIVGAGAAGLAALRELHRAGLRVVCIEALDRIGGRIYSVHDPASPVAAEMGAEFIHGRPPQIFEIVTEAKLPVIERVHEIQPPLSGGEAKRLTRPSSMWRVMDAMEEAAGNGPDETFASFAARAPFDEASKSAATRYVEGFNAARAEVVGIHSLAQEAKASEAIEGNRAFHLPLGYDGIAQALLPDGADLRLQTVVEGVVWRSGEATVHVRSAVSGEGASLTARSVIITVPLGVLHAGAIQFEPEPTSALEAAHALAFGQVVRVTLRFERLPSAIRPGFLFSDELAFPTWWPAFPEPSPLLTGWSSGPRADGLLGHPRDAVIAKAVGALRRIVGSDLPPIEAAYFHDWQGDPFFRGAYSYVPAGKLAARAALAEPVEDTLYFAGEAANIHGHGATVHGAIESGREAARRVLGRKQGI
jgi:monoamine oxidase